MGARTIHTTVHILRWQVQQLPFLSEADLGATGGMAMRWLGCRSVSERVG